MTAIGQREQRPTAAGAARVVVVGAGFGGLAAVRRLARAGAQTTLVDRNIYSTFQPLLYEVATAGLTSSDVAYPARTVGGPLGTAGQYVGGFNPPYTACDYNCMCLAAVKADGTVLMPSYFRDWGPNGPGFGSLSPNNINWYDVGNSRLKYQVLRPRPADHPAMTVNGVANARKQRGNHERLAVD